MARSEQTHFGDRECRFGDKQGLVDDVFHSVARRYDLMNDLMSGGLHRPGRTRWSPPSTRRKPKSRSRCSIWPAAPATSLPRGGGRRTRHSASPSATSMPRCSVSAANFRSQRGYDGAVTFEQGNAEELSYPIAVGSHQPFGSATARIDARPLRPRHGDRTCCARDRTALRHCPARR